MELLPILTTRSIVLMVIILHVDIAYSQENSARLIPNTTSSGFHHSDRSTLGAAFSTTVRASDAPWLRLDFAKYALGQNSYIMITSLNDGAYQRLDATSIEHWDGKSAFFNGEEVSIELFVGQGDRDIFFELSQLIAGKRMKESIERESDLLPRKEELNDGWIKVGSCEESNTARNPTLLLACDGLDTRVPSDDPAVARTINEWSGVRYPGVGSAWLISNGAVLTAGHTSGHYLRAIEFNVPPSLVDGTPVFSHPNNQYPINQSTIRREQGPSCGDDWGVVEVFPNSNTGLFPAEAQNAFHRISYGSTYAPGTTMRTTGYGYDQSPLGEHTITISERHVNGITIVDTTHWYKNTASQTLQTDLGPYTSGSTKLHRARTDIRQGNSGGPMIHETSGLAIGIVTHGNGLDHTEDSSAYPNVYVFCNACAQSFDDLQVRSAINDFWGPNRVYLDGAHPEAVKDGTVFRPYATVVEAVAAAPSGGVLRVVKGIYPGSFTINKALRIEAPVGTVTLGGSGSAVMVADKVVDEAVDDSQSSLVSTLNTAPGLSIGNYPNPFNPTTTIQFSLSQASDVRLVVHDILGREVAVLIHDLRDAGLHEVTFDAYQFASGVYLYRLEAMGQRLTGSMFLLK